MTTPDDKPDKPARDSGSAGDIARTLDPDYEAIHAAVTETARGRWFLEEYARRNRTADTRTLLAALNRLEKSMRGPGSAPMPADIGQKVAGLSETISRVRVEIAAVPRYGTEGSVRRNAENVDVLTEAEAGQTAVRLAHEAAERIQEIVWNLRENHVSSELCDSIDRHAVDIQAACRDGTTTFKSMAAMGRALHHLEKRIEELSAAVNAQSVSDVPDVPDIFADDPALGRFLEDIEIVDVDEVDWEARGYSAVTDEAGYDALADDLDLDDFLDEDTEPPVAESLTEPAEPDPLAELETASHDEREQAPETSESSIPVETDEIAQDSTDDEAGVAEDVEMEAESDLDIIEDEAAPETESEVRLGSAAAEDDILLVEPIEDDLPENGSEGAESAKDSPAAAGAVIETMPEPQPAKKRNEPPADLTGLTFDQKMILFS